MVGVCGCVESSGLVKVAVNKTLERHYLFVLLRVFGRGRKNEVEETRVWVR